MGAVGPLARHGGDYQLHPVAIDLSGSLRDIDDQIRAIAKHLDRRAQARQIAFALREN